MKKLEHYKKPLATRQVFYHRVIKYLFVSLALLSCAAGLGIFGYHYIGHLGWIDSFLNAAMILGGMGPVDTMTTDASKIFSGCYALFSGIAFLSIVSIFMAPFVHRFLHKFHIAPDEEIKDKK